MAKKKESSHRVFDERVRDFLEDFSKEALDVRNSIVNALPAYNALLSLNASTFEEFALQWWAEKQGIDDTSETMPLPECPYCNSAEHVGTKGKKLYRCVSCDRSFAVNYNSIASGMKTDALTWMKVLKCMLEYMGIRRQRKWQDFALNVVDRYLKERNAFVVLFRMVKKSQSAKLF